MVKSGDFVVHTRDFVVDFIDRLGHSVKIVAKSVDMIRLLLYETIDLHADIRGLDRLGFEDDVRLIRKY